MRDSLALKSFRHTFVGALFMVLLATGAATLASIPLSFIVIPSSPWQPFVRVLSWMVVPAFLISLIIAFLPQKERRSNSGASGDAIGGGVGSDCGGGDGGGGDGGC